jgi:hypothetical protein
MIDKTWAFWPATLQSEALAVVAGAVVEVDDPPQPLERSRRLRAAGA